MTSGDDDSEGLYSKLTVTPTATREEIVDSYRKEVRLLEKASKLSHKGRAFNEADMRQQYDDSQVVPDLPTFTRKALKNAKDYCIKHNEQGITVFLPHTSNLAKTWLETCEDHHVTQAKNGGKNGHQIKFPFVDTHTKDTLGSVSIKVYESTQKLLIQGSAYLLWFSECFSELKAKISSDGASVSTGSESSEVVPIAPPDSPPVSLCQTCVRCLTSNLCQACNTTPKSVVNVSVVDENGNETQDGVTDVPDNSLGTQNQTADMKIQTQNSPVDMCIVRDTVNKDDPDLQQIGDNVNSFLKVIAEETEYVHVVDNDNLSTMGSIKRALYSPDGYHINRFGVRVLAANFKRTVNPLLGLGNYTARTLERITPRLRRLGRLERSFSTGSPPTRHGQERDVPLGTRPSEQGPGPGIHPCCGLQ
ncbi:hypothetical protein Bbelb_416510 [Branchiostoma belcheri]|nr:hypothetical protein Bbelb_416510 [Branchiostoma belcheri]